VPHSPGTRGTPSHGQASASATAQPMLEAAAEEVPGEILAACHARASARHAPSAVPITEALPMVAAPSPHRPRTRRSGPVIAYARSVIASAMLARRDKKRERRNACCLLRRTLSDGPAVPEADGGCATSFD